MSTPAEEAQAALERVRTGAHVLPPDYNVDRERDLGRAALRMHQRGTMPPEMLEAQHAIGRALDAGYFDAMNGRDWYEHLTAWFRDRVVALLGGAYGHVTCYIVEDLGATRIVVAPVGFEFTPAGRAALEAVA